jgi:hypothetical protein
MVRFNPTDLSIVDVTTPANEYIVDVFYANHRLWIRSGAGRLWHMGDSPSSWTLSAHAVTATFVDVELALTYVSGDTVFRYSPRAAGAALERELRLQVGSRNIQCVAVRGDTTLVGRSGDTVLLGFVGKEEVFRIGIDAPVAEYPKLFSDDVGRVVLQNRTWRSLFVQEASLRNGFRVLNGEYGWLSGLMVHQVVQRGRPVIVLYALIGADGRSDLYSFDSMSDSLTLLRVRDTVAVSYSVVAFGEFDTVFASASGEYLVSSGGRLKTRSLQIEGYRQTPIRIDGTLHKIEYSRKVSVDPFALDGVMIWRNDGMSDILFGQNDIIEFIGSNEPRLLRTDDRLFIMASRGVASTSNEGVTWDTLLTSVSGFVNHEMPSYRLARGNTLFLVDGSRSFQVTSDAGRTWVSKKT